MPTISTLYFMYLAQKEVLYPLGGCLIVVGKIYYNQIKACKISAVR